jgi:hypothetical protein
MQAVVFFIEWRILAAGFVAELSAVWHSRNLPRYPSFNSGSLLLLHNRAYISPKLFTKRLVMVSLEA